jgi:arginine/ornithine N-succinyltransferase beta subunit
VRSETNLSGAKRALVAVPHTSGYRCTATRAVVSGGAAQIEPAALTALNLNEGDEALIWVSDAD